LTGRRSGDLTDVAEVAEVAKLGRRKVGLVLGAGGLVGLAYHAGVLRALERVGGVLPNDADLIVGSSAGSVVGAYLRSGVATEEFLQLVNGTHPSLIQQGRSGLQTRAEVWAPVSRHPVELGRRILGSTYILARTIVRVPSPRIPGVLQHLFPAGMFSMAEGRRRLRAELPAGWPERPLWLCAVDVSSGRRVVLGRHGPPPVPLPEAVLASCAIPGVYRPVQVGRRTLIDGGVYSSSNLDLAVRAGCDLIIGVIPMAFDPVAPPGRLAQLMRRNPARTLAQEVTEARRRGADVLLIRPGAAEVHLHGIDLMRPEGLDRVARAAYDAAARTLDTDSFRSVLGGRAA
jgi:NTE family protein